MHTTRGPQNEAWLLPPDEATTTTGTVPYVIQSFRLTKGFKSVPLNNATDAACDVPPLVAEAPACLQFSRLSVPMHAMRPLAGGLGNSPAERARNAVRARPCSGMRVRGVRAAPLTRGRPPQRRARLGMDTMSLAAHTTPGAMSNMTVVRAHAPRAVCCHAVRVFSVRGLVVSGGFCSLVRRHSGSHSQ